MLVKREGTEVFGITAYDVEHSTPENDAELNELNFINGIHMGLSRISRGYDAIQQEHNAPDGQKRIQEGWKMVQPQ